MLYLEHNLDALKHIPGIKYKTLKSTLWILKCVCKVSIFEIWQPTSEGVWLVFKSLVTKAYIGQNRGLYIGQNKW